MLKDFFNRKDIESQGIRIANGIIERFPIEVDRTISNNRKTARKVKKKLDLALSYGTAEIRNTIKLSSLGIYGKAKLYKTVQDKLLNEGYSPESTNVITELFANYELLTKI